MAGPEAAKVLGMLWKQAGIGVAIGATVGLTYYNLVSKRDMRKIEAYYKKQETESLNK